MFVVEGFFVFLFFDYVEVVGVMFVCLVVEFFFLCGFFGCDLVGVFVV